MTKPKATLRREGLRGAYQHTYVSTDPDDTWKPQGACYQHDDPELWFPIAVVPRTTEAICWACPVQMRCLEYAWANGIIDGVWGGMQAVGRAGWKRHGVLPRDWPDEVVAKFRQAATLEALGVNSA